MIQNQIRWKQRFENFLKALSMLEKGVSLSNERELSDIETQGLIKSFEFTFELSWNVMKDYLEEQGILGIIGSKNAYRTAFQNGLITDGQKWLDMINDRNSVSHEYDEIKAKEISIRIKDYANMFREFAKRMEEENKKK